MALELDNDFSSCARLHGGASRTRTNNQSVMEHGWCPTNSPCRTPIQDAGCFVVLCDYPCVLRRAVHVGRLFISVRLYGNDIRLGHTVLSSSKIQQTAYVLYVHPWFLQRRF